MKKILIYILYTAAVVLADPSEMLAEANRLYEERHFDSATVLYLEILDRFGKNSAVMYNISNCAYRNGDIGAAILYLERAKLLSPTDPDILANLDFLRTQTVDKFERVEETFIQQTVDSFQKLTSLETKFLIVLVLSVLITLCLGFTLFNAKMRTVKIYLMMVLFLFMLIFLISGLAQRTTQKNTLRCVITVESVSAMNEPRGDKIMFSAHEGTVLNIVKLVDNWYFVSLSTGAGGWIPKTSVEII